MMCVICFYFIWRKIRWKSWSYLKHGYHWYETRGIFGQGFCLKVPLILKWFPRSKEPWRSLWRSRGLYSRAFWLSGLSYISYKIFSFVADILGKSEVVLRIFLENLQFKCKFINNYLFANQFLKYWTGKLLSKYEHATFEGIFVQGFCLEVSLPTSGVKKCQHPEWKSVNIRNDKIKSLIFAQKFCHERLSSKNCWWTPEA